MLTVAFLYPSLETSTVVLPLATPVTKPLASTVAIASLEEVKTRSVKSSLTSIWTVEPTSTSKSASTTSILGLTAAGIEVMVKVSLV